MRQLGPCVICGDKNYELSCGGPSICPSCDCGIDPKVKRLREEIVSKDQEITSLRTLVKELGQALADYGEHDKDCLLAQQKAGRPTEDGGYEMLYGYGKEEQWLREAPPCSCGLGKALLLIPEEMRKDKI